MRYSLAFALQWATLYQFLLSVDAQSSSSINNSASAFSAVVVKNDGNTTLSSASALTVVQPSIKVVTIQVASASPNPSTSSLAVVKSDDSTSLSSAAKITVTIPKVVTIYLARATPKANSSSLSLTTSASSRTISLASESTKSSFSYIIPYNETQNCNIYGPICQTGFITVGVDLTSTTTTTTLPCSSYLTAQSSYLRAFNFYPDANKPFWPQEWQVGFGHSPQCTSYAEVWKQGGQYTFTGCGSENAVVQATPGVLLPSQIPPGMLRRIPFQTYECCGNCTLDAARVKVFYWGDEGNNSTGRGQINDYSSKVDTVNSTISLLASLDEKRAKGVRDIAIVSGYTFTSPSVYVSIAGTVAVKDQCGPLGSTITNPIIALNPRELSTYEDHMVTSIGSKWFDANGMIGGNFIGTVKPWDFDATTSPTWGVGIRTSANGEVYYTIGPPYLPLIIPPPQLLSLDPEWISYCTGYLSNSPGLISYALLDPPEVLTPVTALTPVEVLADETPTLAVPVRITPTAQLAKPTSPSIPKTTRSVVPSKFVSQPLENTEPVQQGDGSQREGGGRSVSQLGGSPQGGRSGGSRQNIAPHTKEGIDMQQKSNIMQGGGVESNFPQATGVETGQQDSNSHANQGKSRLRLDEDPPHDKEENNFQQDEWSLMSLILKTSDPDGQGVSSVPSPVTDEGDSDTSKRATVILSNGVLSLVTPVAVDDGRISHNRDPPPPQAAGSRVLTLASQTILANPSATPPAREDILPDGESILIPGIPTRHGLSGSLFVDSNPNPLHDNSAPPTKSIFTVEGQVFTPNPTGFILAGSKIVPGGVPITFSSVTISLGSSGTLFVGGDAIPLSNPSPLPSLPPNSVFLVGGEVFRADPTGFTIAGLNILPGSAPVTVSGTPVSLDHSGTLFIGSTVIPLRQTSLDPPNSIFTVGGEVFAPQKTGFIIAGSTVLPGDAPRTISGTRISLDPSGELILGNSTIDLNVKSPATVLTVSGQAFTANPHGFAVGDTTVLPGSAPITISGTRISLDRSGRLSIGSNIINLSPPSPFANVYTFGILTFTVQSSSIVVLDGKTLFPDGPAITASARRISLNGKGSLVIESVSVPAETSSRQGQSGNSTSTSTSTSNPVEAYMGGQRRAVQVSIMRGALSVLLGLVMSFTTLF